MATFKYNAKPSDYAINGTDKDSQLTGLNDQKFGTGTDLPPNGPTSIAETSDFFKNAFTWEPKYQHRFIMTVDGIPSYLIKSSAKPSFSSGEVVLDHINIKRKLKGKTVWNSLSITMYDAIVPSGAQSVMQWARLHHESATGRDGYSTQYKKDIRLQQLSGLGEVIEEWTLYGAYLQDVNFGSLDWSTEDVVTIEATLNYDYAFMSF